VLFTEGSLVQLSFVQKEYCRRVAAEYPGIPCFLFGHSTGGAIALKVPIIFYTRECQLLFLFLLISQAIPSVIQALPGFEGE
jgi:surfactin synthase thioesterase subunit